MSLVHRVLAAGLLAALAACGGGADGTGLLQAQGQARPGMRALNVAMAAPQTDLLVQLRRSADLAAVLNQHGLVVQGQFGQRPIYRVSATTAATTVLQALRNDSRVLAADVNAATQAPEATRLSVFAIGGADELTQVLWSPQALGLEAAHRVSVGAGVRVAVLDSGADLQHPWLAHRWARDAQGQVLGRDFVDDDLQPHDDGTDADIGHGHGTHVSGLLAMVAPAAQLMPVRVLDPQGRGNAWVVAEAIGWALDPDGNPATHDGARVINLSLGTPQPTQVLHNVTQLAACTAFDDDDDDDDGPYADAGYAADRSRCRAGAAAVVVAAAGNGGSDSQRFYPAAEDVKGLLSVTAFNRSRQLASFANWGGWIGLAAPGQGMLSSVPGGRYALWSGTSMAAPLAAGGVALLLAAGPGPGQAPWTAETLVKRLTDRAGGLCNASIKGLDLAAALQDRQAVDATCP